MQHLLFFNCYFNAMVSQRVAALEPETAVKSWSTRLCACVCLKEMHSM